MTKFKRTREKRPQMCMKSKENDAKHDEMASTRRKKKLREKIVKIDSDSFRNRQN